MHHLRPQLKSLAGSFLSVGFCSKSWASPKEFLSKTRPIPAPLRPPSTLPAVCSEAPNQDRPSSTRDTQKSHTGATLVSTFCTHKSLNWQAPRLASTPADMSAARTTPCAATRSPTNWLLISYAGATGEQAGADSHRRRAASPRWPRRSTSSEVQYGVRARRVRQRRREHARQVCAGDLDRRGDQGDAQGARQRRERRRQARAGASQHRRHGERQVRAGGGGGHCGQAAQGGGVQTTMVDGDSLGTDQWPSSVMETEAVWVLNRLRLLPGDHVAAARCRADG